MTLTVRRILALVVAAAICAVIYFAFGATGFFFGVGFIVAALAFGAVQGVIVKAIKPDSNANSDPIYRKNVNDLLERQRRFQEPSS